MKKKVDITNWKEVVDFVITYQDQQTSKYWTKEKEINSLRRMIKDEINFLWDRNKINTHKWDAHCWDDNVNKEFKKFFTIINKFQGNSKVDYEDYLSTKNELIKKYGQDWYDDNFADTIVLIKKYLSINRLLELASLMQLKYYAFWSFEIDNDGLFITPKFHQYDTVEHSKYLKDLQAYKNFEVEINQQKSKHIMKM